MIQELFGQTVRSIPTRRENGGVRQVQELEGHP